MDIERKTFGKSFQITTAGTILQAVYRTALSNNIESHSIFVFEVSFITKGTSTLRQRKPARNAKRTQLLLTTHGVLYMQRCTLRLAIQVCVL